MFASLDDLKAATKEKLWEIILIRLKVLLKDFEDRFKFYGIWNLYLLSCLPDLLNDSITQ